jgi:excisionase family DNA binding protein
MTPTEVARLLQVSPSTVVKWADTGMLRYHRLAGSRHRRISVVAFKNFMSDHGIRPEDIGMSAEQFSSLGRP